MDLLLGIKMTGVHFDNTRGQTRSLWLVLPTKIFWFITYYVAMPSFAIVHILTPYFDMESVPYPAVLYYSLPTYTVSSWEYPP